MNVIFNFKRQVSLCGFLDKFRNKDVIEFKFPKVANEFLYTIDILDNGYFAYISEYNKVIYNGISVAELM